MKSIALVPYCPLPANSGGKVEIWKHLEILRGMGSCTIVSAATKPVGRGWTERYRNEIENHGFRVSLREESVPRSLKMYAGIIYAALCKSIRFERAFGHSNPYHRYSFPNDWWHEMSRDADFAVIFYRYWSHLACSCPQVVVLLDLWSDFMWEGQKHEIRDLDAASLVIVISKDEELKLHNQGVTKTFWSPPAVPAEVCADSVHIGLVGSASPVNIEGLRWLELAVATESPPIRIYGNLSNLVEVPGLLRMGSYKLNNEPYQKCGIILMTTALGMGVQIKAIEALAAGRAIVARKGAMRGIPAENIGWIEVKTPNEMLSWAQKLTTEEPLRKYWSSKAKKYYHTHLKSDRVVTELKKKYYSLVN